MSQEKSSLQLVENTLEKIYSLPDGPFWAVDIFKYKKYRFPVTLDVGNGRYVHINPEINGLLSSLSKSILQEFFRPHKTDFTNPEWIHMTKRAFGEALVGPDEESIRRKKPRKLLGAVTRTLQDWIDEIQEREYVFGCDLCNIQDLEPFSIGVVRFEPRNAWLEKIHARRNISKVAFSRIQKTWKGESLRERKFSEDQIREQEIIDTIGKCKFVCSVTVAKAGTEAGRETALTAARLAMTMIAMSWMRPSYTLGEAGLAYDRAAYRQNHLVFAPQNCFGWSTSWSHLPGGITGLKREEWEELVAELKTKFLCAGDVITYLAHGQDAVKRPKIVDVLFQALFWFHEGCREKVDTMAIVKFCAVLEALACGRKEGGIFSLVDTQLGFADKDLFRQSLKRIYRKGRSRTVHGTNDELRHDWSDDRRFAENLCRQCLLSCIQYATEPNYNQLLTSHPKIFPKINKLF